MERPEQPMAPREQLEELRADQPPAAAPNADDQEVVTWPLSPEAFVPPELPPVDQVLAVALGERHSGPPHQHGPIALEPEQLGRRFLEDATADEPAR